MAETNPVLTVRPTAMFGWEQHRPGGCRCVCALYHRGDDDSGPAVCLAAAELGLPIRVEADGQVTGPLPVCRRCYKAMARSAENMGDRLQ